MDDYDARLDRLRAKVAEDGQRMRALRRLRYDVAVHSRQVREQIRDHLDRMQRPTAV
jgi:hypothetical protein